MKMNENLWNLTTTDIGLNIGLYLRRSEVIATDFRPKKEQRESAYVSRKRMWRTLPEPSSKMCPRRWCFGVPRTDQILDGR